MTPSVALRNGYQKYLSIKNIVHNCFVNVIQYRQVKHNARLIIMLKRLAVAGVGIVLLAAVASGQTKAQERIETATQRLDSLVSQAPAVPVRGLISFKVSVHPNDALMWAEENGLKPVAIYHAFVTPTNTFRGGYFLLPGESRADAVVHYNERYRSMLNGYAQAVQRSLDQPPTNEKGEFGPDQNRVKQLTEKLRDLKAQLSEFDRTGTIPVYGLEVVGTPLQLKAMARVRAKEVRLAEVLGDQQPSVPLLPND
jgi:hypothetical protein